MKEVRRFRRLRHFPSIPIFQHFLFPVLSSHFPFCFLITTECDVIFEIFSPLSFSYLSIFLYLSLLLEMIALSFPIQIRKMRVMAMNLEMKNGEEKLVLKMKSTFVIGTYAITRILFMISIVRIHERFRNFVDILIRCLSHLWSCSIKLQCHWLGSHRMVVTSKF